MKSFLFTAARKVMGSNEVLTLTELLEKAERQQTQLNNPPKDPIDRAISYDREALCESLDNRIDRINKRVADQSNLVNSSKLPENFQQRLEKLNTTLSTHRELITTDREEQQDKLMTGDHDNIDHLFL